MLKSLWTGAAGAALLSLAPLASVACLSDNAVLGGDAGIDRDAGAVAGDDPTQNDTIDDSSENLVYRDDLSAHPGCTTAGLESRLAVDTTPAGYTAAVIEGFPCAAKEYPRPADEDQRRALVVLVHGNSSVPGDWETAPNDPDQQPMIAETLVADGWHVYAADFRYDKVDDPPDQSTGNPAKNFDHGWATPILEQLLRSLHEKYPSRKINLAGFSLGSTVIRDALRRMHHRGERPFEYVGALLLGSGANHGVNSYPALCGDPKNPNNKTMRGVVACQLGNRDNYVPTAFLTPLNGPEGAYETPCADGQRAYGQDGVCGGNSVHYTTVVFRDAPNGVLEDEFVSERSAALEGADNRTVSTVDTSGFLLNGIFAHHYGAIRSAEGVQIAREALER